MKHFLTVCVLSVASAWISVEAQETLNSNADNIIGMYYVAHEGEESKVRFTKESDGTYTAQTVWVKGCRDENGNVLQRDVKNPDKKLRNTPCDSIVLITGLEYNAGKQRWDGGKVYDPTRGIRANATCYFGEDGRFRLKGSLLGFSQTVIWEKLE